MLRKLTFLLLLMLPVFFADNVSAINKGKGKQVHKPAVKKAPLKLYKDASNVQVRHFNTDSLKRFKKDPEFNYTVQANADGEPSFFERLLRWIRDHLFGKSKQHSTNGFKLSETFYLILKYVIYAGLLALVIFVIIKAVGLDPTYLFSRRSKRIAIPYGEETEDINTINFDDELEKTISQNNYRLAVRLLYLRSLKQLSDLELIDWQIDKTNSAYVNELANPSQKQVFSLITRQFEYVWYGNFIIDRQAFTNISRLFQDFKQQLP